MKGETGFHWDYFYPPQGFHHILSVFSPLLFFLPMGFYLFGPAYWPFVFLHLFFGLSGSLAAVVNRVHHHSFWTIFLEIFVLGGILLFLTGVMGKDPLAQGFWALGLRGFYAFLLVGCQGLFSAFWQYQLFPRARIHFLIQGLEGENLRRVVRDYQEDASFSPSNGRRLTLFLFLFFLFELVVLSFSESWPLGFFLALVLVLQGAVSLMLFILFQSYRQEMVFISRGVRPSLRIKAPPMIYGLILGGLALLSIQILPTQGYWLSFGNDLETQSQVDPLEQPIVPIGAEEGEEEDLGQGLAPGFILLFGDWSWVGRTLEYLSKALVFLLQFIPHFILGAFFFYLIRFFLRLKWSWGGIKAGFIKIIGGFFLWVKKIILLGKKQGKVDQLTTALGPQEAREQWLHLLEKKRNPKVKKATWNKVVKGFFSIMDWGLSQGIPYIQGQTTKEYLASLAQKGIPAQEALVLVDQGIDMVLFGGRNFSSQQGRDFERAVREITKNPLP